MPVEVPLGTIVSFVSGINALLPRLTTNNAKGVLSGMVKMKRKEKGISLIELMMVVSVLSILAALGAGSFSWTLNKGRVRRALVCAASIRSALEMYKCEHDSYPASNDIDNFDELYNVLGDNLASKPGAKASDYRGNFRDQDASPPGFVSYGAASLVAPTNTYEMYTLTLRARDSGQTIITITPDKLEGGKTYIPY